MSSPAQQTDTPAASGRHAKQRTALSYATPNGPALKGSTDQSSSERPGSKSIKLHIPINTTAGHSTLG
jgi:hypothetical protein